MNIAYLGAGTWGSALTNILASKGNKIFCWDKNEDLIKNLSWSRSHPKLSGFIASENITYTTHLDQALKNAEAIIESVTAEGIRPVFEQVKKLFKKNSRPKMIITSKGIEQHSGLLLPEVVEEVLGPSYRPLIGCLSGPSHAEEVVHNLPTSVVASAYDSDLMIFIAELFNTSDFRVYPNSDILGVSLGGATKNPIAIACGIADGLNLGFNAKAALMTRGLHEMRKLCVAKNCRPETLNGLAGLGDLIVTCGPLSRNYRFGKLISEGYNSSEAKKNIGMVVEGAYTCVSVYELGQKYSIPLPITEAVYQIIYEGLSPKEAVRSLLQRVIKEEYL